MPSMLRQCWSYIECGDELVDCSQRVQCCSSVRLSAKECVLMQGQAPAGMEFEDVEEEYIVDDSGYGSWQPVTEKPQEASPDQHIKKRAKKAKSSQEASAPKPDAGPSADVEEI